MRLTQRAHRLLEPVLRSGDIAIDATAGNGWDTAFLLRCVAPTGRVFAIDAQPRAIENTRARIAGMDGFENVELICGSHAQLAGLVPAPYCGRVCAIMFNLGYLPHGDHATITTARSTLAALDASRAYLAPKAAISILAYPGHPGGAAETQAVADWVTRCGLRVERHEQPKDQGPILWLLRA